MKITEGIKNPNRPLSKMGLRLTLQTMLHLLTISLAKSGLSNFLGDTVTIVTRAANQPAS